MLAFRHRQTHHNVNANKVASLFVSMCEGPPFHIQTIQKIRRGYTHTHPHLAGVRTISQDMENIPMLCMAWSSIFCYLFYFVIENLDLGKQWLTCGNSLCVLTGLGFESWLTLGHRINRVERKIVTLCVLIISDKN